MGERIERLGLLALSGDLSFSPDDLDLILALSAQYDAEQWVSLGRLERSPGKSDNWVEKFGKLPAYIEEVANSLHTKRGMPISQAIATAISRIKKWAVTGEPDTKAKAAKALTEWSALRAKAKAAKAAK